MGTEKRRRHRSRCRIEAVLQGAAGSPWGGTCRDISLHGLYLLGAGGPPAGARCRVEIVLRGETSHVALSMRGRVVRAEPEGVAVAFESMDAETSWHLRHVVVVHSADPARVKRELGG